MESYPVIDLGQAETTATLPDPTSGPVEIDTFLAEYAQSAIELLRVLPDEDPEAVSTPCWRNLMVLRRQDVNALSESIIAFLESGSDTLSLPNRDYLLFDEIIACVTALEEESSYSKSTTLETIATVIGVLGGGAALLSLF